MSLYRLQRRMFDQMRATTSPTRPGDPPDDDGLTDGERQALERKDIAVLYQMGVHPVLLNGFCRAAGFGRNDYRAILEPFDTAVRRKTRWQPVVSGD
jgi:hypothetical protein